MLSDLANNSDEPSESVDAFELSVEVITRVDDREEVTDRRVYTFDWAPNFEEWHFIEFEEYRDGSLRQSRTWGEGLPDVRIPDSVAREVERLPGRVSMGGIQ